jgi:hypothetical protein
MATKFAMTRDINGYNGFGLKPTDTSYSATLTASTDTTLTVPKKSAIGGCNTAVTNNPILIAIFYFTPGAEVWVAKGTTAGAPAGSTFAAIASEGNPSAWEVEGGDVLHFYTTASSVSVGVRFYWLT